MDTLPCEVIRMIAATLDFTDAANARFINRSWSVIAAEFLIERVRFFTSRVSLKRLQNIANHPIFRQTVQQIVYEANILKYVEEAWRYDSHIKNVEENPDRPVWPSRFGSDRERRLFFRNHMKWERHLEVKHETWGRCWEEQMSFLYGKGPDKLDNILARCIPQFPNLRRIEVNADVTCQDRLDRFAQDFNSDHRLPFEVDADLLSDQLRWMLWPEDKIVTSLRSLELAAVCPTFFSNSQRDTIKAIFSGLTSIDIEFRLGYPDVLQSVDIAIEYHRSLHNGVFRDALASATNLEFLEIEVTLDPSVPAPVTLLDVVPVVKWEHLENFYVFNLNSTQDDLMNMLKRQPMLECLHIGLMHLNQGTWSDTLTKMRDELTLSHLHAVAYLTDEANFWSMEFINVRMYVEEQTKYYLSDALDMYVTEGNCDDLDDELDIPHPLGEDEMVEYEDVDEVRALFGCLSDSDDGSSSCSADSE